MELFYRLAADFVVIVHMAFVLTVIFGLLLIIVGGILGWKWVRNPWWRVTHLLMIGFVVFEAAIGMTCPLTTWEKALRARAGQTSYEGDFLANLVHDMLFYEGPAWVFTASYATFGAAVLLTIFLVPPRWRKVRTEPEPNSEQQSEPTPFVGD